MNQPIQNGNQEQNARRHFIKNASQGILAATLIGGFDITASAYENEKIGFQDDPMDETIPVKFTPTKDPSEKKEGEVPSPKRPSKRVGYAFVGLGRLTLNQLLPAISKCKNSKVTALVSGDPAKAKKVALQYGVDQKSVYNYQNFDDIKNNPDVDVVFIVLPNSMHDEFTIRAAEAGKHILCEKPLATSAAAAKKMVEACKKAKVKLMVAYRIQYEPNHKIIKDWVRSGEKGKVKVIETFNGQNIGDPSQWRLKKKLSGGGSLPDIGLYNLNTTRYLLGEEPESVMATIYSTPNDPRFEEVEESVMFQLFFASGVISTHVCTYGVHESRHYTCHTDKGANFGVENAFAYGGLKIQLSEVKDKLEYKSNPSFGNEKDQFTLEIDHMSDCVLNDKVPFTPGEEGVQDHKIMEAIYESAKTGKRVKLQKVNGKDVFRGDAPKDS